MSMSNIELESHLVQDSELNHEKKLGKSSQGHEVNSATPKKSLKSIIYNPTVRAIFFQSLLLLGVGLFVFTVINNALDNLALRGISTGFDFLNQTAGFGIGMSLISYDETHTYGATFIVGLLNTALVAALGIAFATLLGFLVGIAKLSKNWILSRAAAVYIETFRNLPLLLQILFWYTVVLQAMPSPRNSLSIGDAIFLNVRGLFFPALVPGEKGWLVGIAFILALSLSMFVHWISRKKQRETGHSLPAWRYTLILITVIPLLAFFILGKPIGIEYPVLKGFNFQGGIDVMPELFALLIALSIYTAAFIAEIVRSGITSVSKGQTEAASALGLRPGLTLKLVVIPQAMRVIIPPLTSQYLNLVKNSSLAMAIGYPDLVSVFAGTTLNQTGQAIEIISMTMAVYLTFSLLTSLLMNLFNRKMALVER
ncbi:amino acid ABC transporter permease [Photobacterium makurazakiensis]|uniref:amino acid ABC transporter permease n=1 Tax=Photobacterium makurazakiensis TaxID=2910234 RepID=UPI003D0C020A